jgi:DNA-binding NtrC family response regulator
MEILQAALARHGVATERARTCGEALLHLWSERPPHLLFTDAHLADGNWADVLAVARKSPAPVNVIVVSRQVDVSFYVEAIERGAFDFITPPLADAELAHVVRSAAEDVRHRRQRPSPAMPGGLGPEVMSR